MANFQKDRMAVLPSAVDVPKLEEIETRFIRFWTQIRQNTHGTSRKAKLEYSMERKAKSLASDAHKRRLNEAGLSGVKAEARAAVIALAREGARLSGPSNEHDVHRLAAALHAESPWMRDASAWIMAQMLRHVAAGGHGLFLPPVILAGSPGIGKSHYARTLARLAGVPARMIDVGGGSAGFRISGTEKGWSTKQPGIPVETILATRIANPVIVVDEIDKATTTYGTRGTSSSLTTSLLQMLEGTTAAHFECPLYRLPFNMSRVVWIMTANDADLIPAPLRDRSRVFHIPKLSVVDAVAYFDRLTAGNERGQEHDQCRDFIAAMCARPGGISLRQIGQLAGALTASSAVTTH